MIVPAILLSILGTVVLYSSSPTQATQQGVFALVGLLIYFFLANFNYKAWWVFAKPLYILIAILLLVVFVIGIESRGSVRWIPLIVFNLQPSELAKPVMILVLAYFWSWRFPSWRNIGYSLLIFLPIFGLIFRQPDLGTALTLAFIWLIMLVVAGVSWWKMTLMGIAAMVMTPFGWMLMQTYQRQRILSFLFPTQDPLGKGFHVIQSMIAVGSGQLLGRGLGRGTQSRLQFLPEFRTDFIFAFIAEELGFMGSLIVLTLYGVLFYFGYRTVCQCQDRLGQLISVGVLGMLFFQVVVNIGMNSGIMPVTGITLPLLSYGGSSMLSVFICLGLIESVRKYGLKPSAMLKFDPLAF